MTSHRFRLALAGQETGETFVLLVTIDHPDLAAPLRFCSDPTVRLSVDPLRYGTISRGESFDFVLMSAVIPDDRNGSPARAALVLDNVASGMVAAVRSFTTPASVTLEVVTAADPDFLEAQFDDLLTVKASSDVAQVTIEISRQDFWNSPCPCDRMTADRFPALHR